MNSADAIPFSQPYQLCPVCKSQAVEQRLISKEHIEESLKTYYNETIPDLQIQAYHQYRCPECTLEFFHPMQPGSDQFYEFISHQPGYYPGDRWEWQETLARGVASGKEKLLEIGCGNGDFLRKAKKLGFVDALGIDNSASAISVCKARGLNAWCGTIETYLSANPEMQQAYDLVTSYHCLEHVPDPVEFLVQAMQLIKPSGSIFISTPYSPMSFESNWYDPLNHPPHHLTRWNKKAYEALAARLELSIKFYSPGTASTWNRAATAFNIGRSGKFGPVSKKRTLLNLLQHGPAFLKEYKVQKRRDKLEGYAAPDLILVELKAKK